MSDLDLFDHVFVDNKAERTLFLLHGTGGSKEDFLFLDDALGKKFNLVGLSGNVDEGGMRRFFRRIAPGVFDEESIRLEGEKLQRFFAEWCRVHHVQTDNMICLGYSNGANMLLAMLFRCSLFCEYLVLLHAMLPFAVKSGLLDLSNVSAFVSMGKHDEMVSEAEQTKLVNVLQSCNIQLELKPYDKGHELHHEEIGDVVKYLMLL